MPPAAAKMIGAMTVAMYGLARLALVEIGGQNIEVTEVIVGGVSFGAAAFLMRIALAGIRGVKHNEDEWSRKEAEIRGVKAERDALQVSNAEHIVSLAEARARVVTLETQLAALDQ